MIALKKIFAKNRVLVLMYHRIGDELVDPWELSVSAANFEEQLAVISSHVISVSDLVQQLRNGYIKKNSICITFDDGYTDNATLALPVLKKYGCPATFFITSGGTLNSKAYWWDILAEIFLKQPKLPASLEIPVADKFFSYTLENNGVLSKEDLQKHALWRWPADAPTQRSRMYLAVWQMLRDMPTTEINCVMEKLVNWSGYDLSATKADDLPMNEAQLKLVANSGLVSFGVHSVSHPALGAHAINDQRAELLDCRNYLAQHFENYEDVVAYPYGHYNRETLALMEGEKFGAGFTTEEKSVLVSSNKYALGRIKVGNHQRNEFKKMISSWHPI